LKILPGVNDPALKIVKIIHPVQLYHLYEGSDPLLQEIFDLIISTTASQINGKMKFSFVVFRNLIN